MLVVTDVHWSSEWRCSLTLGHNVDLSGDIGGP